MGTLFAVLFVIFVVAALVGLIKPGLVYRWGQKRTRGRAFGLYLLLAIVCLVIVNLIYIPSQQPIASPQKVSATDMLKAYCQHRKASQDLHKQAENKFGVQPSSNIPNGELVLTKKTVAGLQCGTKLDSTNSVEHQLDSLITLPVGTKIIILGSVNEGKMHCYKISVQNQDATLYINKVAMRWYDTEERIQKYLKERSAWIEPKIEELEKKYYSDNGMNAWDVETMAQKEKWFLQCN